MLQAFNEINELAHQITMTQIGAVKGQIDDLAARNQDFSKALNEATAQYVLTGIGRIPEGAHRWNGWIRFGHKRSYFQWDHYFQKLAKDLKRPYVHVPHMGIVIVSRRKYTDVLVGSFLLTAVENGGRYGYGTHPVSYRRTDDKWYFTFTGEMHPLVEAWLEDCKTNPEYRRALRLT